MDPVTLTALLLGLGLGAALGWLVARYGRLLMTEQDAANFVRNLASKVGVKSATAAGTFRNLDQRIHELEASQGGGDLAILGAELAALERAIDAFPVAPPPPLPGIPPIPTVAPGLPGLPPSGVDE